MLLVSFLYQWAKYPALKIKKKMMPNIVLKVGVDVTLVGHTTGPWNKFHSLWGMTDLDGNSEHNLHGLRWWNYLKWSSSRSHLRLIFFFWSEIKWLKFVSDEYAGRKQRYLEIIMKTLKKLCKVMVSRCEIKNIYLIEVLILGLFKYVNEESK